MNSYPPFPPPSVNPWDSQDPWFIHHREGEFPGYTFDEFLGHWVLAYPLEDDYNDVDPVFPALARTLERMIDNGVWGPRPGTEEESDPGTEEEWEHAPPIVESFAHDEPTVLSDPSSEDGERVREPGVTYADDGLSRPDENTPPRNVEKKAGVPGRTEEGLSLIHISEPTRPY